MDQIEQPVSIHMTLLKTSPMPLRRLFSFEDLAAAASRVAYSSLFSNQASFSSRDEALKIACQAGDAVYGLFAISE